jgi:flagellar biosynthesis anti-sigma factor FlgM
MRIDPNARTPDLPESKGVTRSGQSEHVTPEKLDSTDTATLGSYARIQQLSARLQQMPDDRQDRVEALAQAIREGRYNVSPEQIARSILTNMVSGSV